MKLPLSLFPLLLACTDYDLQAKPEEQPDATTDSETTPEDSAPETSDSETTPTGTVTEPPEDSVPEDTAPVATEPVYINTGSTLYSYDPSTYTATRIGNFGIADMTDIAIDLSGHMYGAAWEKLYAVDPTTARATFLFNLDDNGTGLTFLSDGRLVVAGSRVSIVDVATGDATPIASGYTTSGDIIGLPDGYLYWSVTDWSGDAIVKVDPNSGDTTSLGSTRVSGIYGLGYANGEMYGFTDGGRALAIDSSTAAVRSNNNVAGVWWGATTNPVLW